MVSQFRSSKTPWGEKEINWLTANYGKLSLSAIASILGRKEDAILRKIKSLDIDFDHEPEWSKAEEEFLIQLVGAHPPEWLTKVYNSWAARKKLFIRTKSSVFKKLEELGLSSEFKESPDLFSYRDLATLFGWSEREAKLKMFKNKDELKVIEGTTPWLVKRKDLKRWLIQRTDLVAQYQSKIDICFFVDLVGRD